MRTRTNVIASKTAAWIDVGLLVVLAACLVAVVANVTVVRPLLVLAAGSLIPGWALMTRLPPTDLVTTAAFAVAFSLAVDIGGSLLLGWVGWWQPAALGFALGAVSAILLVRHLLVLLRHTGAPTTPDAQCR